MNTPPVTKPVRTPCIGICSTTSVGDPICRGCKRFSFEVINWNSYREEEKRAVLDRLDGLIVQILSERFRITDVLALPGALQRAAIPLDPARPAYVWLHNLLKKQHRAMRELSGYGVERRPEWQEGGLAELIEQVDRELLLLCEAHYARYFTGALARSAPDA